MPQFFGHFFRIILWLGFVASFNILIACSSNHTLAPSQLDREVESDSHSLIDDNLEDQSEALHSYLMGQVALDSENFKDALKYFKQAKKLYKNLQPEIQSYLAELYIRKGDLDSALSQVMQVSDSVIDVRLIGLRASILHVMGRSAEAEAAYAELLKESPDNPEARLVLAQNALRGGQSAQAVGLLQSLLAKEPRFGPALQLLVVAYEKLHSYDKVKDYVGQWRVLNPGNPWGFARLVRALLELRDTKTLDIETQKELKINPVSALAKRVQGTDLKNESEYRALLQNLTPDDDSVLDPLALRRALASFELLRQNFPEASRQLALLLAVNPDDGEGRYQLALAFSSLGRTKYALEELAKVDRSNEWYVRARAFAGLLYRQRGEYDQAERAFRDAIKQTPHGGNQLQAYLVAVLREAKKYAEAKDVFEDLVSQSPQDQRLLFNYGVFLHDIKLGKEAIEVMSRLVEANPQNSEAMNYIAFTLAEEDRDLERALDLIQRALSLQPDNGFYLDTLGWIYFKMGRLTDAQGITFRAAELTNDDAEIVEHLGDILVAENRLGEARKSYRKALDHLVDQNDEESRRTLERVSLKVKNLDDAAAKKGVGTAKSK